MDYMASYPRSQNSSPYTAMSLNTTVIVENLYSHSSCPASNDKRQMSNMDDLPIMHSLYTFHTYNNNAKTFVM
jgi:ankyrin repeat protein